MIDDTTEMLISQSRVLGAVQNKLVSAGNNWKKTKGGGIFR